MSSEQKSTEQAAADKERALGKLTKRKQDEAHRRSPLLGFLAKCGKIVANLCYKNTDACDYFLNNADRLRFVLRQV